MKIGVRRFFQFTSALLVLSAAISFSYLTYWDSCIADLEEDAAKLSNYNHFLRDELVRSVNEYDRAFLTLQHIRLLEIHNVNNKMIEDSKSDLAMQIKNAIIPLAGQPDIFHLSNKQIQDELMPLNTYDKLWPVFEKYVKGVGDYMVNQSQRYESKSKDIESQKHKKTRWFNVTAILNSIGLLLAFSFGQWERK